MVAEMFATVGVIAPVTTIGKTVLNSTTATLAVLPAPPALLPVTV